MPQVVLFPSLIPPMIISMLSDTILNEMKRLKDDVSEDLDEYIVYVGQAPTTE